MRRSTVQILFPLQLVFNGGSLYWPTQVARPLLWGAETFSIMTFSITTFSIMDLFLTLSIKDTHYKVSLCWMSHFLIIMLNAVMLSVVMLNVVAPSLVLHLVGKLPNFTFHRLKRCSLICRNSNDVEFILKNKNIKYLTWRKLKSTKRPLSLLANSIL